MKIGPFTPPDMRQVIEWENEHLSELPVVLLPEMNLSIAGFVLCLRAHEGIALNFAYKRLLTTFLNSRDLDPDFFIVPIHSSNPFEHDINNDNFHGNVAGVFTESLWHLTSMAWEWSWAAKAPKMLQIKYYGAITNLLIALRVFLAHQLLRSGRGLLLHASAATCNDYTYVFLGHSGAGKSTSAYYSHGVLLSDENVAIVSGPNGELRVLGTPFGGEHFPSSISGTSPVFLFVEKSTRNLRKPLSTRNAMARLLSQVVLSPLAPLALWDNTAGIMELIIERHPVEILEAKRDGSFWKECLT